MHFDLAAIPQSDAYKDTEGNIRDTGEFVVNPVGRMPGRGRYACTSDLFLMERMSLAEWKGIKG